MLFFGYLDGNNLLEIFRYQRICSAEVQIYVMESEWRLLTDSCAVVHLYLDAEQQKAKMFSYHKDEVSMELERSCPEPSFYDDAFSILNPISGRKRRAGCSF